MPLQGLRPSAARHRTLSCPDPREGSYGVDRPTALLYEFKIPDLLTFSFWGLKPKGSVRGCGGAGGGARRCQQRQQRQHQQQRRWWQTVSRLRYPVSVLSSWFGMHSTTSDSLAACVELVALGCRVSPKQMSGSFSHGFCELPKASQNALRLSTGTCWGSADPSASARSKMQVTLALA